MNRALVWIGFFVCAFSVNTACTAERPNVILIFSDDQRFDTIGAVGNSDIKTPHLDRLVLRGTTFTHTYIMGSTQPAVCVCSRACLMSGRSLFRAPGNLAGVPLLPDVLAQAGVKTYGIGKWHNGPASYARAFDDGAAIFFGGMHGHAKMPFFDFDKNGKYPRSAQRTGDVFSSQLFADKAIAFLENYDAPAPFFLYVALSAPHDPRTPPGKYKTMYDPAKLTLPKNFLPQHPFDNGELKIRDEELAPFPRTERVIRQHLADYYGMISHLDEHVGRLLQTLAGSTHAKNTVVIFAADNGLAVGQHGLLGKQSMYDHSLRVPLTMAGPGIAADKRFSEPVYLHDLFATICHWQNANVPEASESNDLAALMAGETRPREYLFAAYRDVQRMVRRGNHKLIYYPKIDRTQLFDLQNDPWEMSDLAVKPTDEHARLIVSLREQLSRAQAEYDDPLVK